MGNTASTYPPEREPKIIPRTSMHPTSNRRQTIPRLSSTGRRTWLHSWQLSTSIPARLGSLQSNIQAPFHQAHHGTFCNLRKSSSWDPEHCESRLRGGIDLSRKRLRGEEMGKNPDPRWGLYSQGSGANSPSQRWGKARCLCCPPFLPWKLSHGSCPQDGGKTRLRARMCALCSIHPTRALPPQKLDEMATSHRTGICFAR